MNQSFTPDGDISAIPVAPEGRRAVDDFLRPGENCWRVETADRFLPIVDGDAYFRALREAVLLAQDQLLMIGWDFNFDIEMCPGEADENDICPDGYPNRLGAFLQAVAAERSGLDIHILKWTGSMFMPEGSVVDVVRLKIAGGERIWLALDGLHPIGACHHQKIVVIDDRLAFCGGIDATDARWDTRDHTPADPRRKLRSGTPATAWHDVTTAVTGPAARALGDLCRLRWQRATGRVLDPSDVEGPAPEPSFLSDGMTAVPTAIARTEPPEGAKPLIDEIEQMFQDMIAVARKVIYIESQYFASDSIAAAIIASLQSPQGPEIVVVNPRHALNAVEDQAMHRYRDMLLRQVRRADVYNRFRIYYPVDAAGDAIYVHAKVCIVDDRMIRVGSSNLNRRSMGFDTECDIACVATNADDRAKVTDMMLDLLAEHLGKTLDECRAAYARTGTVRDMVRMLTTRDAHGKPTGRGLREVVARKSSMVGRWLVATHVLNPRYTRGQMRPYPVTSRSVAMVAGALIAGRGLMRLVRRGGGVSR